MRKTALLVIDVQKGLDDPSLGKRNNPDAESNIALLLSEWRKHERPIIHIRHCSVEPNSPLRPELPGNAFKEEAQPLPEEKQFSINLVSLDGEFCIVRSTEEVLKEIA
jgi:nicotinamidase-related amidase